jgi:hypothetical protein
VAEPDGKQGDRHASRGATRLLPSLRAIGWALVLVILAGYFAWMIIEMGAHAVTHAWPMLAVLVAAVAAALAATLGLIVGRRSGD